MTVETTIKTIINITIADIIFLFVFQPFQSSMRFGFDSPFAILTSLYVQYNP